MGQKYKTIVDVPPMCITKSDQQEKDSNYSKREVRKKIVKKISDLAETISQ